MRKDLLASTAIVAVGILVAAGSAQAQQANKPTMSVGGFYNFTVGFVGSEDKDNGATGGIERPAVDTNTNAEVHFQGNAKLDNGISLRAHVELEANTDGDQIDETYIIIRGSFGQFVIGSENGAAEQMTAGYGGASAQVGSHYWLDGTDYLKRESGWTGGSGGSSTVGVSHFWTDEDNTKITYYTPRMSGLQIGASFIPVYDDARGDTQGGNASTFSTQHNGYQIAANYVGKFGGTSIAVAGGYHAASKEGNPATTDKDLAEYGFAIQANFGPARLAMGYRTIADGGAGGEAAEGTIMNFGARYTMGATAISANYVMGDNNGSAAISADNEATYINIGAERTLGPGVKASLNWISADWEGEATGTSDDNSGWALLGQMKVGF